MSEKLAAKSNAEILKNTQLFKTLTIIISSIIGVALIYYIYLLVTGGDASIGIYFGGLALLSFIISTRYKSFLKEKQRRNL